MVATPDERDDNLRTFMPLFHQVDLDKEAIERVVSEEWRVKLGKSLREALNYTFEAQKDDEDFIVRATVDSLENWKRIQGEVAWVTYLDGNLDVCGYIPSLTGQRIVRRDGLIVVCSKKAKGKPVDFLNYSWCKDYDLARIWGRWLSKCHDLGEEYIKTDSGKMLQRWDDVHDGIAKLGKVAKQDLIVQSEVEQYGFANGWGALHGDLNLGNFWIHDNDLCVYDFDQACQGWFEFDIAQACMFVVMLQEAGSVLDNSVVDVDAGEFIVEFCKGYQKGGRRVDKERLYRMILLRKQFYGLFAHRALSGEEYVPEHVKHGMKWTLDWVQGKGPGGKNLNDELETAVTLSVQTALRNLE